MFEYSGSIHMHSVFSDGTGTVPEIAAAANETGLDFIILTDHNTLKAKEEGFEKWFNNTMVIVGYEVNDLENKNHYLVFGLDELIGTYQELPNGEFGNKLSAQEFVKLIKEKGGAGFIAHPYEKRNQLQDHPAYPWNAWESNDFTGIEIWNHMSEWVEGLTDNNKFNRYIHPLKSIIAPDKDAVKKWDELNLSRKVVACGSVDAHAHKKSFLGFYDAVLFPYKILFKSIRTHVFVNNELQTGNMANLEWDKAQIISALRKGNSFLVNNYNGNGKGFRFLAEYDGEFFSMGDEIKFDSKKNKKIMFKTLVPKEAKIKLIKNGKCEDEFTGLNGFWDSDEPGNYRIECWLGDRGWIFSNHIRAVEA